MQNKRFIKYLLFLLVIFLLISIQHAKQTKWRNGGTKTIINSDGIGYYAHLAAIFIYDMEYEFVKDKIEQGYIPSYAAYYFKKHENGKIYNMTFVGNAIMLLPGFLIASITSFIFNLPIDGYNSIFQVSISINSMIFSLLGLYFVGLFLKRKGFTFQTIILVLTGFYFGSNLYYYSLYEPAMTHQYLFFLISLFFLKLDSYIAQPRKILFVLLSGIYGLIVLIRPANGILIFFIPFFFKNQNSFKNFIKHNLSNLIKSGFIGSLVILGILSIQLIVWKIDTDNWVVYGYGDKGFNFLSPKMLQILFSYKKGLFIYTPITFISLFGFYYMFKQSKYKSYVLFLIFIFVTYILSSWWSWYYGGSYGLRAYIDYFIIFMIPLAYFIEKVKYKWLPFLIIAATIAYTQIQIYQYKHYIIHNFGQDKHTFWKTFLRTKGDYVGLVYEPIPPNLNNIKPIELHKDFENGSSLFVSKEFAYNGEASLKLMPEEQTVIFKLENEDFDLNAEYFMEVSFYSLSYKNPVQLKAILSLSNQNIGNYKWITNFIQERFYESNKKWKQKKYTRYLGKMKSKEDVMLFYFELNSKHPVYIDNLTINLFPTTHLKN
ncbi:MAG: hypothetical protein AB7E36_09080 [Salinivirgaceae bacterium]